MNLETIYGSNPPVSTTLDLQNLLWTGQGMGSGGGTGTGSGTSGLPAWVHIPKPSKCSGPSTFNSKCTNTTKGSG